MKCYCGCGTPHLDQRGCIDYLLVKIAKTTVDPNCEWDAAIEKATELVEEHNEIDCIGYDKTPILIRGLKRNV